MHNIHAGQVTGNCMSIPTFTEIMRLKKPVCNKMGMHVSGIHIQLYNYFDKNL